MIFLVDTNVEICKICIVNYYIMGIVTLRQSLLYCHSQLEHRHIHSNEDERHDNAY